MPEDPRSLDRLPTEVLALVLSHVPLSWRLRDCACVNSTWHTTAVLATYSIALRAISTPQSAGLPAWLEKNSTAAQVSQLVLHTSYSSSSGTTDSFSEAVGHALPALQRLHSLHMGGDWRAAAVVQLSSLHKLQELHLSCHSSVLRAAIATAPTGLTSVALSGCSYLRITQEQQAEYLNTDLAELTPWPSLPKLQKLELRDPSVCISFPAVARLPELRTCIISADSIALQDEGPTGLSALSGLTSLQHLDLTGWLAPKRDEWPPVLDASDCAALTASTQLTFLSLHKWQLQPGLCGAVFPPKRQLPLLRELHLGPCFLQTPAATARVVSAASGLTALTVHCIDSEWVEDDSDEEDFESQVERTVSLVGVQQLHELQALELKSVRLTDTNTWSMLAIMTQLTGLWVSEASIPCLPGILQLTTLTRLNKLEIWVVWREEDCGYTEGSCCLEGARVPVFLQLPGAVVNCAADLFSGAVDDVLEHAGPVLLEAARAVCPAALELFWASEHHWKGLREGVRLSLMDHIDLISSIQPLVDVDAGADSQTPLSAERELRSLGTDNEVMLQRLLRMWQGRISRLEEHESSGALIDPFVREGKQLLAAVQRLKEKTRRLCQQRREELERQAGL